jgi:hypothetical protein
MDTHSFYMIVRSRAQYSEMAEIVKDKINIFFDWRGIAKGETGHGERLSYIL